VFFANAILNATMLQTTTVTVSNETRMYEDRRKLKPLSHSEMQNIRIST
jgi:hypothetical protein